METNSSMSYGNQDLYDGSGKYREVGSASTSATFRNGFNVGVSYSQDHFLDQVNIFHSIFVTMPRNEAFRGWTLAHTRGDVAGGPYTSTTARVFYRPIKRLQLDLRYQTVDHFDISDQAIMTLNWEMDKYRSLGGRLVSQDGDLNWFVSYKMSGNLGAEYFLILGDPNATTFQKTLIFKVTVPLAIGT
jgi:hypothetical protein